MANSGFVVINTTHNSGHGKFILLASSLCYNRSPGCGTHIRCGTRLTSLANSPQNWKDGSKQNRKGRSKQKGASNPSSTLPIQTQNRPSSSSSTSTNEVRPPSNPHQTPALQNSSPDSKTNFRIIWGTQKSVTANSIKA